MSDIAQGMYERLLKEVQAQTNSDRERVMTHSGLPYYRVPESFCTGGPMACCYIRTPCQVHRLFFEPRHRVRNHRSCE